MDGDLRSEAKHHVITDRTLVERESGDRQKCKNALNTYVIGEAKRNNLREFCEAIEQTAERLKMRRTEGTSASQHKFPGVLPRDEQQFNKVD